MNDDKNLIDVLDEYISEKIISSKPTSLQFEVSMHKYIKECLISLEILTFQDLERIKWIYLIKWFKSYKTTLKNSSINKVMKFFNRVLNYFEITNPLGKYKALVDDTKGYPVPTYDVMEKIYKYIFSLDNSGNNLLYKLIISLLRDTGCRKNELLNLRFSDISYNPNMIVLETTKNGDRRVTSFGNKISKVLIQKAYKKHHKRSDYVLYNYLKNERCSRDAIDYCMDKVIRNSKIPKIHSHMIRKFFATDMYNKLNGDILTVQKLLGHSSVDLTQKYIKDSVDFLLQQYKKVID